MIKNFVISTQATLDTKKVLAKILNQLFNKIVNLVHT